MKKVVVAVLIAVLAAVGVWYVMRGSNEPEPPGPNGENGAGKPAPLSAEDARRLLELMNTGLGHLENHQLTDAATAYEQVTRELPAEEAGWRNLAIARVFRIEEGLNPQSTGPKISDPETAFAEARAALDSLAEREPDSAALHFLRGKLASLQQDPDTATREFAAAGKRAAAGGEFARLAAGAYYAATQASEPFQSSDETKQLGRDALRLAHEAAPDNLFLTIFWSVQQALDKDATLAGTLAAIRPDVEYVASRGNTSQDSALDYWNRANEALKAGDWAAALLNCRYMTNLVKGAEPAQSDRDYEALIHVLDFVASDFSRSFYERAPAIDWPDEGVPVTFSLFPRQVPAGEGAVLDACLADADVDGRLDVCVLRAGRVEVWRAAESGGWDVLASAELPEGFTQMLVCDLDDDAQNSPHAPEPAAAVVGRAPGSEADAGSHCRAADPDIVVCGAAGVLILENVWDKATGQRSLAPPSPPEPPPGAEPFTGPLWPETAGISLLEAADLNLDGDLDLLLFTASGPRLWSNRSAFQFQDVTDRIGFPDGSENVVAAFPVDWDRDTDIDVLLALSDGTVGVLECLRHLTFRWRRLEEVSVDSPQTLAVVELDGNVSWDVLVGGPAGIQAALTRTPVTGRVVVDKTVPVADAATDGLCYWDYDNDGVIDVVAWDRNSIAVARGLPGGGYRPQDDLLEGIEFPVPLLRCETGDVDGDGDVDLLVVGEAGVLLCSNDGGDANGWLEMTLAALFSLNKNEIVQTRRTNHYGVGSTLELKSGAHYQAQVVRGQSTHFGLGKRERADVVRVTWTNGFPENTMRPEQRQNVCQVETPKGSCPFLYTWNGERFVFATDLCWAAPLGMQTAQGGIMPGRSWEYLLVPGELLAPRDGRYVLQCTGELWEAEYFDQVELMVLDHPDEFEVYSNEKVGPPEITEFKIHTARTRHYSLAAHVASGRDVLAGIAQRDGVYARPFETKHMQGYTEDSLLELDLGPVPDPANVKLFLTGWMFPTDTSINVALAENPLLPGPQAPSVWVPDEDGEWQQVIPSMGFPGGKTKTIVVDLSGKFLSGDHRVRIATSMEIYWDEIFFTSGEETGEHSLTPLTAVAADLHFRGFSRRIPQPHHAPPVFDYDDVRTEPAWAPMQGCFTRFGDVTELITTEDDRMVILYAGDEMTVEFVAPPPPPVGWKRDFLLHNVGWDKDADLNTVLGQTVEPLPFAAMSRYPYPAAEHYPDTPLHREYLQKYQTRTIDDAPFRRLIHAWRPGTELVNP